MDTITQALTGAETGTTGTSGVDLGSLMSSLAPFILGSTIITVVIVILYAFNVISKYRANKAILDIKKLLIEMNERDKFQYGMTNAQNAPASVMPAVPKEPTDDTPILVKE